MSGSNGMSVAWSRRAVLFALGAGVLSVVPGCGIRLEHDAPHLPFVPTLEPAPDQDALLKALDRARSLWANALLVGGRPQGLPSRLAGLHEQQVTTLERLLQADDVPVPTASPAGGATTSSAKRLGAQESEAVTGARLAALGGASPGNLGVLGALLAQQGAAGTLLGHPPAWRAVTGPTRDLAASVLRAVRPAVYGFEVIAARTPVQQRSAASAALDVLNGQAGSLERLAGASAGPAALGYRLPFPVTDEASRRRLAERLISRLIGSTAAALEASAHDADAAAGTVQLLAGQVVLGARWGVALTPFPGLAAR